MAYRSSLLIIIAVGILLGLSMLACACSSGQEGEGSFPEGFLWGAAVAGFQVDMGCPTLPAEECEDPDSDWYVWVTSRSLIEDPSLHISGDPVGSGPGHWELFEHDFDLAADELHLNAFRTSIEWSRIFPTSTAGVEGQAALSQIADLDNLRHYRLMFSAMRDRGLTPLVTLNHYTLPTWIHDAEGCHFEPDSCARRGWLDRESTVAEIAKFAGFVAAELSDLVDLWATQNEPYAVVIPGYLMPGESRSNPPGLYFAFDQAKTTSAAMVEAHARMYDAVKAADLQDADGDGAAAQIGLVYAVAPAHPADPSRSRDVKGAENLMYLYNYLFLDAVVLGKMDEDMDGEQEYRDDLAGRMDYLGLNYYAVVEVEGQESAMFPGFSELTSFDPLSLAIDYKNPRGIYEVLELLGDRYPGLPIIITENGMRDPHDDGTAPRYLVEHLTWLSRAVRDGAPVLGYFYWSLMDNYEWNLGMDWCAGLYAVDPDDPEKKRLARRGAGTYSRIASSNRIPAALLDRYPVPER